MFESNLLFYGDNLEILRKYIPDETIDLIYLDPPFNSKRAYNIIFKDQDGKYPPSQIRAFDDTWHWSEETENAMDELSKPDYPAQLYRTLLAFRQALGTSDLMAYLVMMAIRLAEMYRVLKPTGSIYLHCDPTASHYLKIVMDQIFGIRNFRNEIVWCYSRPSAPRQRQLSRVHETIFWYSKGENWIFNPDEIRQPYSQSSLKRAGYSGYASKLTKGKPVELKEIGKFPEDSIYIPIVKGNSKEYIGYPTQKPVALLERIIKASSNEGDWVLDPFCGCGTTVAAAEKLNRRWIGIDITILAINLIEKRINDHFPDAKYIVKGIPTDLEAAKVLARQSKYLFEQWFIMALGGQPYKSTGGADRGIDGFMYFKDLNGKTHTIIVSVKGGSFTVDMVRSLKGVVERENAAMGLLLSLQEPTPAMKSEAASAGFFQMPEVQKKYPKLQIFTVKEFFEGKRPDLPDISMTLKTAPKLIRENNNAKPLKFD